MLVQAATAASHQPSFNEEGLHEQDISPEKINGSFPLNLDLFDRNDQPIYHQHHIVNGVYFFAEQGFEIGKVQDVMLLDIDETVVEMKNEIYKWLHREKGYCFIPPQYRHSPMIFKNYKYIEENEDNLILGPGERSMPPDIESALVAEFVRDQSQNLPAMQQMAKSVVKLHRKGITFVAVTAMLTNTDQDDYNSIDKAIRSRVINLLSILQQDVLGSLVLPAIALTHGDLDKNKVFELFHPDQVLGVVDDSYSILETARDLFGFTPFLVAGPYNQKYHNQNVVVIDPDRLRHLLETIRPMINNPLKSNCSSDYSFVHPAFSRFILKTDFPQPA